MTEGIDVAASRSELYAPSAATIANANVPDYLTVRQAALNDPVAFWDARAKELIEWYKPYTQILDTSSAPFFKWFVGGKTNVVHNALDRHVQNGRKDKTAIIWEGEDGETRTYTYAQPLCQCVEEPGRQEGRHRHHLHGARRRIARRHVSRGQNWRHP